MSRPKVCDSLKRTKRKRHYYMDDREYTHAARLAKQAGRSVSGLIRWLITRYDPKTDTLTPPPDMPSD